MKNTFKRLIDRLTPANKNLNYVDVKELADIMIAAKAGAEHHVMLYLKASKDHEAAFNCYMQQCKNARKGQF